MENRAQIVQKFASVAEHPEQCYDFDIQGNLDTFFHCARNDINFSEAAFLVFDAARIYGRKVDYLEQTLLDFNQRSAANISKAMAEKEKEDEADAAKKDKKAEEQREKREREKERALKRAKRMLKVTSKVEFKPKPFEMVTSDQISLNLHEQRSELECEEEFDQLRMKNVFPRINVLQSNLNSNNTFYDNLGIVETDVENFDSLRDFRIFMDTIDEPIFTRPLVGNQVDPKYEQEYKRSMERANQKHSNIYLPADYIKENYGITLKDNSDYLNMLKYNEEVERLNLRKLTIEQLSKLKVGTYLNNILHGNKQDGKIAEHDSGIDCDDMDRDYEPPVPDFDADNTFDELSTLRDELDVPMTDLSTNDTSKGDDTLNASANPSNESIQNPDQSVEQSTEQSTLNTSQESQESSQESTLNTTADTLNTTTDSALGTSADEANTSLEASKETDRMSDLRQSLDDGIGGSECNSPSRISELESFEGFNSTDLTGCADIGSILNAAGEAMDVDPAVQKAKVPELDTNIFQLPENLLRRNKIFALTDEYELWMAARKRKHGLAKPDPPLCGKLLKLSNGVVVRCDPDSDSEEFLGFDENNVFRTAPGLVVLENKENPGAIVNRTCSSDSGISPEKALNGDEAANQAQTTANDTDGVNDSGFSELNSSADETLNTTAATVSDENGENAEKSIQETDVSLSDGNINANSTKLFNETASILTGMDSGFAELESQLDSTCELDGTSNSQTLVNPDAEKEGESSGNTNAAENEPIDEAIECGDDNANDSSDDQHDEDARNEGYSDMVERVNKWHEMLRPILANSEKRNNFDIHALGSDIIEQFPVEEDDNPREISFTDLMRGRDQTYTARYFLSLLLLTNTKNVDLKVMHPEQNGKVICSKDDIRFTLRSRTRHLDEVNKIDQHLNEPHSSKSNKSTGKAINIEYNEDDEPIQSTSKGARGKKTAQKRKLQA